MRPNLEHCVTQTALTSDGHGPASGQKPGQAKDDGLRLTLARPASEKSKPSPSGNTGKGRYLRGVRTSFVLARTSGHLYLRLMMRLKVNERFVREECEKTGT